MSHYTKRHKSDTYRVNKKRRDFILEPGLKGFICTCNFREHDCIREAYNILNEYADRIFGMENWRKSSNEKKDEEKKEIDEELAEELAALKREAARPSEGRRFQVVESQANNCLFIRSTVPDPVKLAVAIVEDIEATQQQKTKFLLRLLPIENTCKANFNDITSCIKPLLDKHFTKEGSTFAIVINCRNNSKIDKVSITETVAQMVKDRNIDNRVDLKNPEKAVLIEIIKGNCGMGILPNYYKYKKYNLLELCGKSDTSTSSTSKNTDIGADGDSHENKDQEEVKETTNNEAGENDTKPETEQDMEQKTSSNETPEEDVGADKEQACEIETDQSPTDTKEEKNDVESAVAPAADTAQDSAAAPDTAQDSASANDID